MMSRRRVGTKAPPWVSSPHADLGKPHHGEPSRGRMCRRFAGMTLNTSELVHQNEINPLGSLFPEPLLYRRILARRKVVKEPSRQNDPASGKVTAGHFCDRLGQ